MKNTVFNFIRELLSSGGIPFHCITLPCQDWSWMDLGLRKRLLGLKNEPQSMNQYFETMKEYTLYHYVDFFQCSYSALCLPEETEEIFSAENCPPSPDIMEEPDSAMPHCDTEPSSSQAAAHNRHFLVIGPVLFEALHGENYEDLFQRMKLPPRLKEPLRSHYQNIAVIPSLSSYENLINVIARFIFRREYFQTIFNSEGDLENLRLHYSGISRVPEQPFLNIEYIEKRYDAENMICNAVSHCNEAQAIEGIRKLIDAGIPPRLSNSLRDKKDLTITINTLMRKAAESAGVHPVHIDSFSNRSIQQIEELTSIEQCQAILRRLALGYCRLVRQYSLKGYSLPVRKAITYVTTDLSTDLSLKALSCRLNVTPSYLSSLFRKEMDMTLTDYVNQQRIAHAQYLLQGTNTPIKSIAQQCGIADLNYFVRIFKRITGVTPKSYRDKAADSQQMGMSLPFN